MHTTLSHATLRRRSAGAFSLVELSIVLVILGLLVGGVLSGQSLIHASELRSLTTQHDAYIAAVNTFRDKYFAVPGDMPNATSFWGVAGGSGNDDACFSTASTSTATCNGNGDGFIFTASAGSATNQQLAEPYRAWQHMANAGLITGAYSGDYLSGPTKNNSPMAKIKSSPWSILYVGTIKQASGEGGSFDGTYGNTLQLGETQGVLNPEDMWNIDTKMDDGLPAQGKLVVRDFDGIDNHSADSCTTALSTAQVNATYQLSSTATYCMPIFRAQF